MPAISSALAASLANNVYALTKELSKSSALRTLNLYYDSDFTFADDNLLTGTTGGPPGFKVSTGMGFVLLGKKGKLKGHAFIVFRGTQYLAEWLTNFNVSATRSESGHLVHDGFHQAFL